MLAQGSENTFHGQSDNVAHGTLNAFDQTSSILLGGITTCFVEGMNALQILFEVNGLPGAKLHSRGFHKAAEFFFTLLDKANTRQHFVDATTKPLQHGPRFVEIAGLSKDLPIERNQGVGAQNDAVWKPRGDFHGLAFRVEKAKLPCRPPSTGQLFSPGGLGLKIDSRYSEQVTPPLGSGCQKESGARLRTVNFQ
ncbi:MAG TPA: hypothetical protein VIS96_16320 [Terrimicrobiaceae bacterium]